jgi:hypothetical protein
MLIPIDINIATDFIFTLLPVPIVWKLRVKIRTRLYLIGISSLGLMYVICYPGIEFMLISQILHGGHSSHAHDVQYVEGR